MKYKLFSFLVLLVFLMGCTQQQTQTEKKEQSPVCNKPYILVGTGCCLDKDGNSICDTDEKEEPKKEIPAIKQESTQISEDAQQEAKSFAYEFARLWEKKDYSKLYDVFVASLKNSVSKDEFLYITSEQDKGTPLSSIRVNEIEIKSEKTGYVYFSANILGVDIKIPAMAMEKEKDGWKSNAFYSFFQPIEQFCDKGNTSTGLDYKYKCLFDFAKKFNKPEYCDKIGFYIMDCYKHFSKQITKEIIIQNCISYKFIHQQTTCLLENNLNPDDILNPPIYDISIDISEEIINYSESEKNKALNSLNVSIENKGKPILDNQEIDLTIEIISDGWSERTILDGNRVTSSFKQGNSPIVKRFSYDGYNDITFKKNLSIQVELKIEKTNKIIANKTKVVIAS